MSSEKITPHFTRKELECRCGCGLCEPTPALKSLIEKVRAILGVAMYPTSCHRCAKHNAAVGGEKNSRHLTGDAMDFQVTAMRVYRAYAKIVTAWKRGLLPELGSIGLYVKKNFIHIDTYHSADGHLRTWRK